MPPVQGEPPRILPPIPGTPTRIAITAGASGLSLRGGLHFYPLCPSGSTDSGKERARKAGTAAPRACRPLPWTGPVGPPGIAAFFWHQSYAGSRGWACRECMFQLYRYPGRGCYIYCAPPPTPSIGYSPGRDGITGQGPQPRVPSGTPGCSLQPYGSTRGIVWWERELR